MSTYDLPTETVGLGVMAGLIKWDVDGAEFVLTTKGKEYLRAWCRKQLLAIHFGFLDGDDE